MMTPTEMQKIVTQINSAFDKVNKRVDELQKEVDALRKEKPSKSTKSSWLLNNFVVY